MNNQIKWAKPKSKHSYLCTRIGLSIASMLLRSYQMTNKDIEDKIDEDDFGLVSVTECEPTRPVSKDKIDEQTLYEAIEKDIVLGQNNGKRLLKVYRSQVENEARLDELKRAYPNMQKHYGEHGEGNYYFADRIATLNKENTNV